MRLHWREIESDDLALLMQFLQLVATLAIAVIGWKLPELARRRRESRLLGILLQELCELKPPSTDRALARQPWYVQVESKAIHFIHRDIFTKPSANAEFVLSLDPELAYNAAQMWTAHEMACRQKGPNSDTALLARFAKYYQRTSEGLLRSRRARQWWATDTGQPHGASIWPRRRDTHTSTAAIARTLDENHNAWSSLACQRGNEEDADPMNSPEELASCTKPENPDEAKRLIDFFTKDWELKVRYLSDHLARMWTRFNYLLVMQTALLSGKVVMGRGDSSHDSLIWLGFASALVWYVMGAEDRYLARTYREDIRLATARLSTYLQLPKDHQQMHVGNTDATRPGIDHGLTGWRWSPVSTTRLAAIVPGLAVMAWTLTALASR